MPIISNDDGDGLRRLNRRLVHSRCTVAGLSLDPSVFSLVVSSRLTWMKTEGRGSSAMERNFAANTSLRSALPLWWRSQPRQGSR
jgi:hypothetical protein